MKFLVSTVSVCVCVCVKKEREKSFDIFYQWAKRFRTNVFYVPRVVLPIKILLFPHNFNKYPYFTYALVMM